MLSFADGHCDYKKWRGTETIKGGKAALFYSSQAWDKIPKTPEGFQDLYWMQKGTWGRLGYTPSH